MKEFDKLLSEKHTPKRELSANFTEKVIGEIKSRPEPASFWSKLRSKVLHHAWVSGFAGFVFVGGAAAATVVLWPTPSVSQLSSTPLANGNRIVAYNAKNCDYFSNLDGHSSAPSSNKIYYEIKSGSKLTNQQLKNFLLGVCQENLANNAISRLEHQLPKMGASTLTYKIDAVLAGSITVSPDPHYGGDVTINPTQTYSRFSNDLLVFSEGAKISFADLKVGDSIKFIYNDTSGLTETPQNHYIDLNHPDNIVVSAILEVAPLVGNPFDFDESVGTDLVRVEPSKTSPTGFVRAYDFVK